MPDLVNITYQGYPITSGNHIWYGMANAFDGFPDSWWESDRSPVAYPVWLGYRWTDRAHKVVEYKILVPAVNRPISWVFQASNDAQEWLDLDIRQNQLGDRMEWLVCTINNNNFYSYYRIRITDAFPSDQPVRIYELELWVPADTTTSTTTTTTTTTTTSSTTTTTSTSASTLTSASTTTTTTTTGTTSSTTTTAPEDILWPALSPLDEVRTNINDWYKKGVPVGVKQVSQLPIWDAGYQGIIVFLSTVGKYYLGATDGWEELNLGNVPHAVKHASDMSDELVHIGPTPPNTLFAGKIWIEAAQTLSSTTTTTASTSTTSTTSSGTTQTTTTTTTTTSTSTTTTTTQSSTTTTSSTSNSTTTMLYYPENVALGGSASADSAEIGYEASKAYDNIEETRWISNFVQGDFPHWLKYVLKKPAAVHSYSIKWDDQRYAYSWVLEGSNSGYLWEQVHSVENNVPQPFVWNYYQCGNTKIFSQYRFRFFTGNDFITQSVGIYGCELYAGGTLDTTTSTTTTSTTTTSTSTTTTSTSTTELGYINVAVSGSYLAIDELPNYLVDNVFDANTSTMWVCDPLIGPPYWIMCYWDKGQTYAVDQYRLYLATPGRPVSWKFQGSSDGTTWVDLDTKTDIYEEGWFETVLPNNTRYGYYRLLMTKIASPGYAVRIGSFELWVNQAYRTSTTTTTMTTTSTSTTLTSESTVSTTTQTTASTTGSTSTLPIPLETALLLNFNGSDGSTELVDETTRHSNIQWIGDAKITAVKAKFGGSSLSLSYNSYYPTSLITNSYLQVPTSTDWVLGYGLGQFTIDFWVYIESYQNLWRVWNNYVSCMASLTSYWALRYLPESQVLNFSYRSNGSLLLDYSTGCKIEPGTWNHIALTRMGDLFKFYYRGTAVDNGLEKNIQFENLQSPLSIGEGPSEYYNTRLDLTQAVGCLDGFRISKGALFTSDFTPPGEPTALTTGSTTITTTTTTQIPQYVISRLTLRCDDGGNSLYDSSGRHGTIPLTGTNTTFTGQFCVNTGRFINPKFSTQFFSASSAPTEWLVTEAGYISVPNNVDWWLGDNGIDDFTIEAWLAYKEPQFKNTPFLSHYQDPYNYWVIYIDYDQDQFHFRVRDASIFTIDYTTSISFTHFDWNYFAFMRSAGQLRLYWQGAAAGNWYDSSTITIPNFNGPLYLFGGPSITDFTSIVSSGVACNGLRISKGLITGVGLSIPTVPFS